MRKKESAASDLIWHDRDALYDLDPRALRLTNGEFLIERIDNVEDVKGSFGDRGLLRISNLRLIWHAVSTPRLNMSIGFNAINGISTSIAKSKIRGQTEALFITATGLLKGNLGVLVITNIRVVWYAALNPQYNVSIPFLQLKSCRIRDSRFGDALVLESSLMSGEYVLGFQIKPEERLEFTCKAVQALLNACHSSPIFGVQYSRQQDVALFQHDEPPIVPMPTTTEEKEPEEKALRVDAFAAYFSGGPVKGGEPRPIVFSEELGMAIEQLKPGFTIADLWEINVE
uniref:Bardet-Biedl syndrome 5 protein homolog n=1 Tax=Globodera pallida TaxID=36090 RepID=A0A183BL13_GLOPA